MKHFWNIFIQPALRLFGATTIVEIGSDTGIVTEYICKYILECAGKVHVVDPDPAYDPEVFFSGYADCAFYWKSLSLNFLAHHELCDAYIIDGDHNWYTVYNELKLIESKVGSKQFPLLLFHDTAWPYGRRDLYYFPDNIPPDEINPYKRQGILFDAPELVEEGGLNNGWAHCIYEGTPRNGVLTAVEDFLAESDRDLVLVSFPIVFGFSLLVERAVAEAKPDFNEWLQTLQKKQEASDILRFVERIRIDEFLERKRESSALEQELLAVREELTSAYAEAHALRKEKDDVHEHVRALYRSWSWKVTAPFRLAYDVLAFSYRCLSGLEQINFKTLRLLKFHSGEKRRFRQNPRRVALDSCKARRLAQQERPGGSPFGSDVVARRTAARQEHVQSKNALSLLRRVLYSMRYSPVGDVLYSILVPATCKRHINNAWAGNLFFQKRQEAAKSATPCPSLANTLPDCYQVKSPPVFVPDPAWYENKNPRPVAADCPVKLIAFYLPQFHPFPENDALWGEGFTEWTNVTKAKPLFDEHYQPKLPGALGFYDLRLPDVMRKQAALAKEFGVHGFCFYHYYFAGKRLMETPVDNLLANTDIDLPFCLCWANENWTRRWDGSDQDILIAQEHSPADDIRFLNDIQKYFDDPRYIRVDGNPFLIIYKASQFPDMAATIGRWRAHMAARGQGIYLVMAQTFGAKDPTAYGFDAAVEFPPHIVDGSPLPVSKYLGDGGGRVYDAADIAEYFCTEFPEFTLYKTIFPAWDNTARRGGLAHVYENITPTVYRLWLLKAARHTMRQCPQSPFLFINAWNEWAEGAYLEPDSVYGYAYLNATSRALQELGKENGQGQPVLPGTLKIVFVTHDFCRAGAQIWLLTFMRWMKRHTWNELYLLCIENGGELENEFSAICPVLHYTENDLLQKIEVFCNGIPDVVYGNTAVSGSIYSSLQGKSIKIITHVHELQSSIEKYVSTRALRGMLEYTDLYIAASDAVRANLADRYGIASERMETVYECIRPAKQPLAQADKRQVRKQLGIPENACVVLGCGSRSLRKGTDIFARVAKELSLSARHELFFCWVGAPIELPQHEDIACHEGKAYVHFVDAQADPSAYFLAADIFALTSREDPFPLVCLEAADAALPVVCFAGTGGMPDFVRDDAGIVVSGPGEEGGATHDAEKGNLDEHAFAMALHALLVDEDLRKRMGQTARRRLLKCHTDDVTAPRLLNVLRTVAGKAHPVSVIVPNYNYAEYLEQRLDSIARQTFRDMECVLLDDASTDDSVAILRQWESRLGARVVVNAHNSGNVFAQWRKGLELTGGDIVWIAEADDTCRENFLEVLLLPFADDKVRLSYSIPDVIDAKGNKTTTEYTENYLSFASVTRWDASYRAEGAEEIEQALGIVNAVPNVSACLFRRPEHVKDIEACMAFTCSGDWFFYLNLVAGGRVAYTYGKVASHRRHEGSVIAREFQAKRSLLYRETMAIHGFVESRHSISSTTREKMRHFRDSMVEPDASDLCTKSMPGFCPACGHHTLFFANDPWLHDHYICSVCGSIPRERALHHVLNLVAGDLQQAAVIEFAPNKVFLANKSSLYTASQYFPDMPFGEWRAGVINLDMEHIVLPDASYDLVVHSDVLEHLFDPGQALRECVRICKPGGHVVFTVPIDEKLSESIRRCSRGRDGIVHHLSEEYHGNPVGDGRSLVVWNYGNDFEMLLASWLADCACSCTIVNRQQSDLGIEGRYLHVVMIRVGRKAR